MKALLVLDDTFVETVRKMIEEIADSKAGRYWSYGVERDDLVNEMWTYALGGGKAKLERLLGKGDTYRAARALATEAKRYGEIEKAEFLGYEYGDVAWYDPKILVELIPLALDPEYDMLRGQTGDGTGRKATGNRDTNPLPDMIADVRRAIVKLKLPATEELYDITTEPGRELLHKVADFLGGDYPGSPSRGKGRRAVSNAAAQRRQGTNENVREDA